MATKIFVDQENIAAPVLSKDHLKRSRLAKPLKVNTGKVFGCSGTGEKTVRKALGNVNKPLVNLKAVPGKKSDLEVKKLAPVTKKVSETCAQNRKNYPEIEKIFSYNPEAFETLDVPKEHKLTHLCLTGVPLMVNGTNRLGKALVQEPSLLDIPVFSWDSELSSPYFLAPMDDVTLDLPEW